MKSKTLVVLYTTIIIAVMGFVMMLTVHQTVSNSFAKQINREQDGRLKIARDRLLQLGQPFSMRDGRLYAGKVLLNGNQQLVDELGTLFGGIVTIYSDQDGLPVATNIRLPDGSPAIGRVGSRIPEDAYEALFSERDDAAPAAEGAKYRNEQVIKGEPYYTSYDLIRDADGQIIGILEVGTPSSPYQKAIDEVLWRNTLATLGAIVIVAFIVFIALNKLSKELAKITGRAQALLNSTREGVIGMDKDGDCTFINNAACMFLGYEPDDVLEEDVAELVRPPAPEGSTAKFSFAKIANSQDLIATEDEFVRNDGTRIPVRYFVSPVMAKNEVEGYVLSFMNVAEEKKAAQRLAEMTERLESIIQSAQSAQRAKSAFLATTGAEISRSGEKIRQAAEHLLTAGNGSGRDAEEIRSVRRAAESLLLTNQLVGHLAEIESGRVKPGRAAFSPAQIAGDAVNTVAPFANDRQISLRHDVAGDVPSTIESDATKSREILIQLLREASAAASPGASLTLRLRLAKDAKPNAPALEAFVEGAPSSYDAARLKKLLDAYRDADDPLIRDFGTGGLGIVIAKNLAELLGGSLQADQINGQPVLRATFRETPVPAPASAKA